MKVYLIGYRGTGKSAVAPLVAQKLHLHWTDADDELEQLSGRTIAQIFAQGGEAEFRDLESQVIADLVRSNNRVLALGGGAVLREENRRAIKTGRVFWLRASVETIHRRIEADAATAQRRPNLTAAGGPAEIGELLAAREPLYRACADHEIDTELKTPEQVANEIVALVRLDKTTR